jgi:hypothetical protein
VQVPSIKFDVNPRSGSCVDTCGRTDGQTRVTKLSGAFGGYAHVSEYCYVSSLSICCGDATKEREMRRVGGGGEVHGA